jgi:hypothetical protein
MASRRPKNVRNVSRGQFQGFGGNSATRLKQSAMSIRARQHSSKRPRNPLRPLVPKQLNHPGESED